MRVAKDAIEQFLSMRHCVQMVPSACPWSGTLDRPQFQPEKKELQEGNRHSPLVSGQTAPGVRPRFSNLVS